MSAIGRTTLIVVILLVPTGCATTRSNTLEKQRDLAAELETCRMDLARVRGDWESIQDQNSAAALVSRLRNQIDEGEERIHTVGIELEECRKEQADLVASKESLELQLKEIVAQKEVLEKKNAQYLNMLALYAQRAPALLNEPRRFLFGDRTGRSCVGVAVTYTPDGRRRIYRAWDDGDVEVLGDLRMWRKVEYDFGR